MTTLRLVDPACGSGAFLIAAFDHLHRAYRQANDRLQELHGALPFDIDRDILRHNLYGVDLNTEAVEICRLGLWIKTAKRGEVLTSLDHTIRAGNSVIADPAVHPRAFDWQAAFPEVTAAGGFDVVVGNPPYVRQEWLKPFKAYWQQRFQSYHSAADLFVYFFELGLTLLKPSGRLGYITSGGWVRGNYGEGLRAYLAGNCRLDTMIDFGEYQPFDDAEMIRPTIVTLSKAPPDRPMRLFRWLTSGSPPEALAEQVDSAPLMRTDYLGRDPWELEPDNVIQLRKKLAAAGKPLNEYVGRRIYRGILTGLTEVFVIDDAKRAELVAQDPRSAEVIMPFAQGTHARRWHIEDTGLHVIAIKSSADQEWPWSGAGEGAEDRFRGEYPAVYHYLAQHKQEAMRRSDQGRHWWELRSCGYWSLFDAPKIVWPDIGNYPRFSMDGQGLCLGNTTYFTPGEDYYLLAILASWPTWFFISKTAQPLRLRSDRWQYRLFTQSMVNVPVPEPAGADRDSLAELARACCRLARERYLMQQAVRHRLTQSFAGGSTGEGSNKLNEKAQEWWEQSLAGLGDALKQSFKLKRNPFSNPKAADEWEPYLADKVRQVEALTRQINNAEAELNERVFRLFALTADEVKLLQDEVSH